MAGALVNGVEFAVIIITALSSLLAVLFGLQQLGRQVSRAITRDLAACVARLAASVDRQAAVMKDLKESMDEHRVLAQQTHAELGVAIEKGRVKEDERHLHTLERIATLEATVTARHRG